MSTAGYDVADANALAVAYDGSLLAISEKETIWTCLLSTGCRDLTRHPTPGQTASDVHVSEDGDLLIALDTTVGDDQTPVRL